MSNLDELPEDSDSSDEDYIPDKKVEEAVSEVDSDGVEEDSISDTDEANKGKGKKRRKKIGNTNKKTKKREVADEPRRSEEPKPSVDDLWADFIKDTGFKSKSDQSTSPVACTSEKKEEKLDTIIKDKCEKTDSKVKITQIFEFAGEEVKVEKEVDVNSAEARLLSSQPQKPALVKKPGSLKGIGSVLNQIGKKQKLSILEKTKLDWNSFKKDENIEEELEIHNKGKDGYLDRQDFLQRTDVRQFEIEKSIRDVERSKRFNSTV